MEQLNNIPQAEPKTAPSVPTAAQNPEKSPSPPLREPFPISKREVVLFPLLLVWCVLYWWVVFCRFYPPALGGGLLVLGFYLLMWAYLGPPATRSAKVFLLVNGLLALSLALSSDSWARWWNWLFLHALIPFQLYEWARPDALPWGRPRMILQRFRATVRGLFLALPVNADLFRHRKGEKRKPVLWVFLGLIVAAGLLCVIFPLLLSADALFSQVAGKWVAHLPAVLRRWAGYVVLGAISLPFLFGFLYTLRAPERFPLPGAKGAGRGVEATLWLTALVVLDGVYLFFLAVQSAALFGGPDYLALRGITYAAYARSGFFQLVGVVFLNLTVLLTAVQFSKREGKLWRGVQQVGSILLVESLVLLASAAWRMTLYVQAYGLSYKRLLTYWGMVMALLFLIAAFVKLWKPSFRAFRVCFAGLLAGWLLLTAVDPAYLVAKYNVDAYKRGELTTLSAQYLSSLSYDTLGPLSELSGSTPMEGPGTLETGAAGYPHDLHAFLTIRRRDARAECGDIRSWSLSAFLASYGR